jgi:putative transposase
VRIITCVSGVGRWTASGWRACGARGGCGWRSGRASVGGSRTRPCLPTGCGAQRPAQVWAFDFQFDQTADGRVLKQLTVVDEFTREALVMLAERSIDADTTVSVLERLAAQRGAPEHLRMDNGGPELTAHAPGLVSLLERRNRVHRARLAVAEPVRRELPLTRA